MGGAGADWGALLDSADGLNALRVAAIAAGGCTTIVIGISYLFERSQQLLVERTRSLAQLRAEQLDKERISKELELREAAFRKARELRSSGVSRAVWRTTSTMRCS